MASEADTQTHTNTHIPMREPKQFQETKAARAWFKNKDYTHLTHMLEDVIQLQLYGHKLDTMKFDKPSTLPHNIATVDKPPKEQVIATYVSRFSKHTQQNNEH